MIHRGVRGPRCLVVAVVLVTVTATACLGVSFRSIGLRAVVPLGDVPFLLGLEAAADVSFGVASATFFLSTRGETLIAISGDIRLSNDPSSAEIFLRLSTGISYFDPAQPYPAPFLGAGLSWDVRLTSAITASLAGEFLYPLSFPVPLMTIAGRWSPG
ncbi:MAG: hypothetical protein NTY63_01700 [Candidatus Bipolaricaulota bacterium]|nr:hypothetical protein [Candidatus Bipolaricaulota bacterium]